MKFQLEPIHCRPWTLSGLSLPLIESHYENNYGGALRRLNAISAQIEALDMATVPPHVLNGLKREELIALNSTLLHELYFASLGGEGRVNAGMAQALAADFGSVERWRDEFTAMARGLAGGSGWVLLTYLPREGRLANQYAADHGQAIAGAQPILALDMYEHAYHMDFGANATAYIDTFLRNVDWNGVEVRMADAKQVPRPRPLEQPEFAGIPAVGPEEVRAMLSSGKPVQVIDARPRHSVSRAKDIMEGATWHDPDRLHEWIGTLSRDTPAVVFCAYGFHVGCRTAAALRDAGIEASFMKGGHSAWRAIGGSTKLYA